MSTAEGPASEPLFSEMMSQWLDEGDRPPEGVMSIAIGVGHPPIDEREGRLARAHARAKQNPWLASAVAGALLLLGVWGLHAFAHARVVADREASSPVETPVAAWQTPVAAAQKSARTAAAPALPRKTSAPPRRRAKRRAPLAADAKATRAVRTASTRNNVGKRDGRL
jgi:hypothetical protein